MKQITKLLTTWVKLIVCAIILFGCADIEPLDGNFVFINKTGKDLKLYVGIDSTFSKRDLFWIDSLNLLNNQEFKRRKDAQQTYPFGGNRMKISFSDGKVAFFSYRRPSECISDPECNNSQNPFYNKGKSRAEEGRIISIITYTDSLYLLAK